MDSEHFDKYGPYRDPAVLSTFYRNFYNDTLVGPSDVEYVEAFGSGNLQPTNQQNCVATFRMCTSTWDTLNNICVQMIILERPVYHKYGYRLQHFPMLISQSWKQLRMFSARTVTTLCSLAASCLTWAIARRLPPWLLSLRCVHTEI